MCEDVDEALEENAARIDNHEPLPTEQESMKSAEESAASATAVPSSTVTEQKDADVEDEKEKEGDGAFFIAEVVRE